MSVPAVRSLRVVAASVLLLVLAACGRVGFASSAGQDSGALDTGAADSGALPDSATDTGPLPDSATDAARDGAVDAGPGCNPGSDDTGLIAHFPFDEGTGVEATDLVGGRTAAIVDAGWTTGPDGCGSAVLIEEGGYVLIDDDPSLRVPEGSIDFWFKGPAPSGEEYGILSRDARDLGMPGHLSFYLTTDGMVVVRIQGTMAEGSTYRCSAQRPAPMTWTHVALVFGASEPELYVDGVPGRRTVTITSGGLEIDCGTGTVVGDLAGNRNPWVLGAAASFSAEGSAFPLGGHFVGGALDELRISDTQKAFEVHERPLDFSTCDATLDGATVALYEMEDVAALELTDSVGRHDGTFATAPVVVPGPPGCGNAVAFDATSYGLIPPSRDFSLTIGSVDFWVLPPSGPPPALAALLSRDASGRIDGHFAVFVDPTGRLGLRMQTTAGDFYVCADDLVAPSAWTHLAVNLGAPNIELWIDGVLQNGAIGSITGIGVGVVPCGSSEPLGTVGNDEYLTLGAGSLTNVIGVGYEPITQPFIGGALDHVRWSSVRRDFSAGF